MSYVTEEWWTRKEISLWLTSYLTKTHFANARETVMRGWIICLKICKYTKLLLYTLFLFYILYRGAMTWFVFVISGMITRSQGSTTGTWRTKPARVMRRTTSLSSEMEMEFTTMNSRRGKALIRNGQVPPQPLVIVKGRTQSSPSSDSLCCVRQGASEQEESQGWNSVHHKRRAGV